MMLTSRFCEALTYAAELHARQKRKLSAAPYVAHLLSVTAIVLEYGGGEDEAIAGLLHDAVEDCGGAAILARIRDRFGDAVADRVADCSDTQQPVKEAWRWRKERHLAHVRTAPRASRLIVAADKLDNLRALVREYRRHGEGLWAHFKGGRDGTLWYQREMLSVLRSPLPDSCAAASGLADLLGELERTLAELEQLVAGV